jgi:predicted nuclease of predicted toxin-antitoxin system
VNLLLDQGLPRLAVPELRRFGFDVVHAGDVGMAAATDDELLLFARREGRVIVTLDADFHALLALSNAATPSVVRIRIEGLRAHPLAALLRTVLMVCDADLRAGAMVSVDTASVRVRALPLAR